jgi:hypothetical protein
MILGDSRESADGFIGVIAEVGELSPHEPLERGPPAEAASLIQSSLYLRITPCQ